MTAKIRKFLQGRQPETPCLVVDLDVVSDRYAELSRALPGAEIFYAMKANPDPEVVQKNKTDFETDGRGIRFFATGDIGQITPEGTLKIIDRKKDLVKLQMGEYVALSKVENVLKECPLVELPLCYADSKEKFCVALVCPSHVALKALGRSLGLGEAVPTLCANKQIIAEVSKQCLAVCKPKLVGFESPKVIGLVLTLTLTLPEPEPEPEPSP